MVYKANPLIFLNARKLRNKLTPAEQVFLVKIETVIEVISSTIEKLTVGEKTNT